MSKPTTVKKITLEVNEEDAYLFDKHGDEFVLLSLTNQAPIKVKSVGKKIEHELLEENMKKKMPNLEISEVIDYLEKIKICDVIIQAPVSEELENFQTLDMEKKIEIIKKAISSYAITHDLDTTSHIIQNTKEHAEIKKRWGKPAIRCKVVFKRIPKFKKRAHLWCSKRKWYVCS